MLYTNKTSLSHSDEHDLCVLTNSGEYSSLISKDNINRDSFFHLRRQLISLGCPEKRVVEIAQQICMDALGVNDVNDYLTYLLNDTYDRCKRYINNDLSLQPIQNPDHIHYSHIALFSSIYYYEITFLQSVGLFSKIADIGCGDGLFMKLTEDHHIKIEGYDCKVPKIHHDVNIQELMNYEDIKKPYECIVLNHVLEHNRKSPEEYLNLLINYFKMKFGKTINKIIVSLPMHTDLTSHLASNHFWICSNDETIDSTILSHNNRRKIQIFNPEKSFKRIAVKWNYNLIIKNELGVYVFTR